MKAVKKNYAKAKISTKVKKGDLDKLNQYLKFIKERRQKKNPAKIFDDTLKNSVEIATLIAAGGLVVIPWGKEQRRILCILGCYDNIKTTSLINKIKGRTLGQTLAIGCLPSVVGSLAEIDRSIPLKKAAQILKSGDLEEILHQCFTQSLGLILHAKKDIPKAVKERKGDEYTVLIAGEHDYSHGKDIYTEVLYELHTRFGKVIAGTSANLTGQKVYSVFDQEKAYEDLKFKVDGFVRINTLPSAATTKWHLTSSTIIDLTGTKAVVRRWGNMHPLRFTRIFSDLIIPEGVPVNENAELKLV